MSANPIDIHVDPHHPDASDGGAADEGRPLKSLQRAMDRALDHRRNGRAARILVHRGLQRVRRGSLGSRRRPGRTPDYWVDYGQHLDEIVRHGEIVFGDSGRFQQVLTRSDLAEGRFCVDESQSQLVVAPPSERELDPRRLEIASRACLWHLDGLDNIHFCGLTFTHAATPFGQDDGAAEQALDELLEAQNAYLPQFG